MLGSKLNLILENVPHMATHGYVAEIGENIRLLKNIDINKYGYATWWHLMYRFYGHNFLCCKIYRVIRYYGKPMSYRDNWY